MPLFRTIVKPAEKVAVIKYHRTLKQYKDWAQKRTLFIENLENIQNFLIEHFEEGELRMQKVNKRINLILDEINDSIVINSNTIKSMAEDMKVQG